MPCEPLYCCSGANTSGTSKVQNHVCRAIVQVHGLGRHVCGVIVQVYGLGADSCKPRAGWLLPLPAEHVAIGESGEVLGDGIAGGVHGVG